jgi:uncharacterized protein YbaR (Trm112 family)
MPVAMPDRTPRAAAEPPWIDDRLLDLLVCPLCKAPVRRDGDRLACTSCGRRYPVRGGIPVMLVEEAETP